MVRGQRRSCAALAAVRLRVASRDCDLHHPCAEEWFLIEWPEDDKEPFKYWLSTLPDTDRTACDLVATAKMRWRIEREIIASSSRNSASGIMRGEVGGAYTITPVSASQRTGFSSRNGRRFPPQHLPAQKRRKTSHSPRFPTRYDHQSGPNATPQIRSRRCVGS